MLYKISIILWTIIIILTGTYFRVRPVAAVQEQRTDWLVASQIVVSNIAGLLGIILLMRYRRLRLAAKILIIYVIAAGLSAIFSNYQNIVIGYWIVLVGTSLITIGILQQPSSQKELSEIENVFIIIITLILIKDTAISLLLPELIEEYGYGGPFRVGMGSTHPVSLSLLAAIAFWMSYKKVEGLKKILVWVIRIIFISIIVMARSRISIICFFVAGFTRYWCKSSLQDGKGLNFKIVFTSVSCGVICLWILAGSFEMPWATKSWLFLNRDEVETISYLTGRVLIWEYALKIVLNNPIALFFGYGYGISRFVLNEGCGAPPFFASHAHNTLIEILLSMGLVGVIPFMMIVTYGLSMIAQFRKLCQRYSSDFALRAVSVICIIFMSFITESILGGKIGPIAMIFIFYFLALDKNYDRSRAEKDLGWDASKAVS